MAEQVFGSYAITEDVTAKRPAVPSAPNGILALFKATDTGALSVAVGGSWITYNPGNTFAVKTVDIAAKTNVNISTGLAAGQTIDGVTLVTGYLVLLAGQTTASENGIYVVPSSGAAQRAFTTEAAFPSGTTITVTRGTRYAQSIWKNFTSPGFTIGTTPLDIRLRSVPGVAWIPSDDSGAGLTFTNVSGHWFVVDGIVFALADVTFPVTANTNAVLWGNLPFTVPGTNNPNYRKAAGVITFNSGAPNSNTALVIGGTTQFQPINNSTGGGPFNNDISGKRFIFYVAYPID